MMLGTGLRFTKVATAFICVNACNLKTGHSKKVPGHSTEATNVTYMNAQSQPRFVKRRTVPNITFTTSKFHKVPSQTTVATNVISQSNLCNGLIP